MRGPGASLADNPVALNLKRREKIEEIKRRNKGKREFKEKTKERREER